MANLKIAQGAQANFNTTDVPIEKTKISFTYETVEGIEYMLVHYDFDTLKRVGTPSLTKIAQFIINNNDVKTMIETTIENYLTQEFGMDLDEFITNLTNEIQEINEELAKKLDKKPDGTNPLINGNDKINTIYLPDMISGMTNCGTYDASTGTMLIDLRTPPSREWMKNDYVTAVVAGDYYPDGTKDITTPIVFAVGDWAVYDGENWYIIPNTDAVSSVNGKTGAVVLSKSDIGLGNVDNVKQASKTDFDIHVNDLTMHFEKGEKEKLGSAITKITNEAGGEFEADSEGVVMIATGTNSDAGLTKLYTSQGNNRDGSINQQYLTSWINGIVTFIEF